MTFKYSDLNLNFTGRICDCGPSLEQFGVYDTKNIFITYGCENCLEDKLSGYRHDVLYGNDYETEERVEALDD